MEANECYSSDEIGIHWDNDLEFESICEDDPKWTPLCCKPSREEEASFLTNDNGVSAWKILTDEFLKIAETNPPMGWASLSFGVEEEASEERKIKGGAGT